MTDDERRAAKALRGVTYPVASFPKRFARSVSAQADSDEPKITDPQAETMWRQVVKFRRQIPSDIVELARTKVAPRAECQK